MAPTVSEQAQQLQITLSPNTAAYNGVYSNSLYDLTNRMVQVESVQAVSQAGWCENFLEVELNANNYFMIQVGAGNMLFRARVNGVNDQTSIPFDGTANRFWRLRHDQSANQIYFETSANGTVWLTRKTVTPGFALTALRFHLLAGAYGSGNSSPGAAKHDNFKLLASLAPTSLTVPNAGFETPVLGNGNFQYSPSGGSWTFADGGGITGMNSAFTGSPSAAPEGVQVAFIQSTGTVSQSISGFQANADYVITFSAIQRTNCCNAGGQDIGVYIDNTQVGSFHPSAIAYTEYSTPTFSTTAGPHTVKFVGLNPVAGGVTAFIDKVRITGSPKPGFGVQWLVTDHLGTPRLILDQTGSLANIKRHDYLPFGEELFAGTGARTTALGYTGSDGVRQHFTLKERDVETGLDYFGARYYGSTQGRFTSPDPLLSSGKSLQPQSWNRYSYCLNDPLKYVDPNGLIWQMQTTVKDNVSTTTYKWVWQDDPEEGWERVTDFHPDVVGPDGRTVGLHLNPNGPKGPLQILLELDPGWGLLSYQDDFHVKGYEYTDNAADRAASSARGSLDMMPNQAFDVGLFFSGGGVGRLSRAGAAEGTTTLFRAVGNAEFEQLMRTGTFEAGPNALGGKWFWESAESAQKFGLWAEGKGAFKIVDAKIPTVQADRFMRLENLDGIGPARYAELPELKNATIGKKP